MICKLDPDLKAVGVSEIVSAFKYGSKVYGVDRPDSDNDYIIVTKETPLVEEQTKEDCDFHFYSEEQFLQRLDDHELSALECLWLPESEFSGKQFSTNIDTSKLRRSISAKASNSWVKAKKKLEVEHDYLIGKKSLWHSLRILLFGKQIAIYGKIVDYRCANHLYSDIVKSKHNNWGYFYDNFKPKYNAYASEFKKVAPK